MAAPLSDSNQRPLQNAMKLVKVAIQLDTSNKHKEAYCEYLRSINYISHALLEEAASTLEGEMESVELEKMVKLVEQCLERVKSCIIRKQESPTPATSSTSLSDPKQTTIPAINALSDLEISEISNEPGLVSVTQQSKQQPTKHRRVLSEGGVAGSPFLPPEVFQKFQTVESQDNRKELTPIEEASRLNQKLKANYEARLARLTPGQATQKTSLTLSLQRQMMENLIIAKARQDALQRKMEERRLRLQEEANRRFATCGTITPEEQEQRVLYASVLEYEHDHEWPKIWKAKLKMNPNDPTLVTGLISCLLSYPDHPVMKLLKKLQYHVYSRLYPIVSQCVPLDTVPGCSLPLKPSRSAQSLLLFDSHISSQQQQSSLKSALTHSLSDASISLSPSHDLNLSDIKSETELRESSSLASTDRENSFEDLEKFLTQLDWVPSQSGDDTDSDVTFGTTHMDLESHIHDREERALKGHLKTIVKDIHNAIDRLLSLCLLSFECLNTAVSKDQCVASIEEVFFTPIWRPLLALFRRVNHERELAVENSMRLHRNVSPGDLGVASKLFPRDTTAMHGSYPYESAVQELKLLCRDYCPQKKLECIVRTLRIICGCAEEYRLLQEKDPQPKSAAIGADDLLPILAFVALRSEMPQLVSECAALEEFIHEGYLIGEEGYCLTSMQSALTYVESLFLGGAPTTSAKTT
ncbi:VPS9 domain-containing protein 1-like [Pimephales promelas]|uniref:VPS9 domain-containing protein 1-like n=1 Tax=Pimephales promelas TaxID=90988 RepID=UPI0019555856|nr:VPS9 domain-containing protein 1-like [Pimephales promelas]XP_039506417.1 VPS9 domain-containing protein 1-like [Pimephales promelas]XP_039506418.1 VPS9 domain-containing protein 1-like [Pimephales promelas]